MHTIFIKLGGSVITDKNTPFTTKKEVICRLANEIYTATKKNPEIRLLIGHGSGSFGHTVAKQYPTPRTPEQITEIHEAATQLHAIVFTELESAGLKIISRDLQTILENPEEIFTEKKIPVVYGDIADDGRIYSTEDIFTHLLQNNPNRSVSKVLLITDVDGVRDTEIFPVENDVTGGMAHKIESMKKWQAMGITSVIINGNTPGALQETILKP